MHFKKRAQERERLDLVARLYLGFKFFNASFFTYPIFYEFATRAISPVQVGLFFTVIGITGLIAEVPTGIIADKNSRKTSGLLGVALLATAPLLVFFGHVFWAYMLAAVFYGIGRAFLSGALESLVYDHKNVSQAAYRRINSLEITFGQAGILVSAAFGGLLFSMHPSLPFVAEALSGLVCMLLIARMSEINKDSYRQSVSSHRQHFVESMQHLLATPFLRVLVLMGVTFSVMLGMCIQFVNEAAMIEHGFDAKARGVLIAGAGLLTIILLNTVLLRFIKSDNARLGYLAGGAAVAYVAMGLGTTGLFLAGYAVWCCLNATSSFIRVMLHDRIPGSHRSTIMSNFKALAILIGVGSSAATGLLVQHAGTPRAAYDVFAIIAALVLVPCACWLVVQSKQVD